MFKKKFYFILMLGLAPQLIYSSNEEYLSKFNVILESENREEALADELNHLMSKYKQGEKIDSQ